MQIAKPLSVSMFCETVPSASLRLFATPDGQPWANTIGKAAEITTCVGPEGGFTEDELQVALASQWNVISLGRRILRIETAAVAIASAVAMATES